MTVHAWRLPFELDPLMKEAQRRARHRRTLIALAVVLIGLAAGLTLALRSPGGPSSGPSGLVRASYAQEGVSFRYPATWTKLECGGIVLTTAHPVIACPQPALPTAPWPREPLAENGVTLH